MAEAIVVIITLDQVGQCIIDVIDTFASPANAPTKFHTLIRVVVAALACLFFSTALHVPVLFHLILHAGFVFHTQVRHLDVAHVVKRDETLGALVTHRRSAPLYHIGTAILMQLHHHIHLLHVMLSNHGEKKPPNRPKEEKPHPCHILHPVHSPNSSGMSRFPLLSTVK